MSSRVLNLSSDFGLTPSQRRAKRLKVLTLAGRIKTLIDDRRGVPRDELYQVRDRVGSGRQDVGLRDRHKADKLSRISEAAYKLFAQNGYEATSLREIAREAGVALGTLSLYASDKRDLILMIFNQVIPPLLESGVRSARGQKTLVDGLVAFFEPFYRSYARNVTLYRIVLGQIYAGPLSVHANENNIIRIGLLERLSDLISDAVMSGECCADVDLRRQARSFYYLYFAAVRAWLSEEAPKPKAGLAELRALFTQHVSGILAVP